MTAPSNQHELSQIRQNSLSFSLNKKDFLSKASFQHRANLDSTGQEYLEAFPSLRRVTLKPKHLTILHPDVADRTAAHLYSHFSSSSTQPRLFIELNPGVCRVSRSLLDQFARNADTSKKLALFSDERKFQPEFDKLVDAYPQVEVLPANLFTQKAFSQNSGLIRDFMQRNAEFTQHLPPVVYGIVPWSQDFITTFFTMYTFETCFFDYLATESSQRSVSIKVVIKIMQILP